MKITFKGVPDEKHASITQYGYIFPLGKPVDVQDAFAIRKLKSHPHFEVADDIEDAKIKSETSTGRADLEQTAAGLGLKVDGRWSDERLRAEVEKAAGAK